MGLGPLGPRGRSNKVKYSEVGTVIHLRFRFLNTHQISRETTADMLFFYTVQTPPDTYCGIVSSPEFNNSSYMHLSVATEYQK